MIAADASDAEAWEYLHCNKLTKLIGQYEAEQSTDGDMCWPVTRHDTPFGCMFEHQLGPFPMVLDPSGFLHELLIEMWSDLRELFDFDRLDDHRVLRVDLHGDAVKSLEEHARQRGIPDATEVAVLSLESWMRGRGYHGPIQPKGSI